MTAKQAAENFTNAFSKFYGTDPNIEQTLERIRLTSETANYEFILNFSSLKNRKKIEKELKKLGYNTDTKDPQTQDDLFYLDVSWELNTLE